MLSSAMHLNHSILAMPTIFTSGGNDAVSAYRLQLFLFGLTHHLARLVSFGGPCF
jgi:hypothetical protein